MKKTFSPVSGIGRCLAILAIILIPVILTGCVTQTDGTKKVDVWEGMKRADKSVDNYFDSM